MKDNFITKAKTKFDNFFDYSFVEYINAKTKVKIICPYHGEFLQTPDKHLQATYPCPICNESSRKKRHRTSDKKKECTPLEIFLDKFKNLFNS